MYANPQLIALLESGVVRIPFCSCWFFVEAGRENRNGYGRLYWNGKELMAHRLMYEALVGPIPDGLVLDHTCSNRCCINPAHLEPVTVKVNTYRGKAKLFGIHLCPVTHQEVEHGNLKKQTIHLPDGASPTWLGECRSYPLLPLRASHVERTYGRRGGGGTY